MFVVQRLGGLLERVPQPVLGVAGQEELQAEPERQEYARYSESPLCQPLCLFVLPPGVVEPRLGLQSVQLYVHLVGALAVRQVGQPQAVAEAGVGGELNI